MRILYVALAALVFSTLSKINPAWADASGVYGEHMMWGGGGFMGPMMMFVMLIVVVLVIVLIVRWLAPGIVSGGNCHQHQSAVHILEERFARGEIDKAEFDERKKALGG